MRHQLLNQPIAVCKSVKDRNVSVGRVAPHTNVLNQYAQRCICQRTAQQKGRAITLSLFTYI